MKIVGALTLVWLAAIAIAVGVMRPWSSNTSDNQANLAAPRLENGTPVSGPEAAYRATPTVSPTPTATATFTPTPQPLTIVVFLQGLGSRLVDGREPGQAKFSDIQKAISAQPRGRLEFVYYSYTGLISELDGKPLPLDYSCPNTSQELSTSERSLEVELDDLDSYWKAKGYLVHFALIGHSLGGLVAITAMKDERVTAIVTLDSPLMGVESGKTGLESLAGGCSGPVLNELNGMHNDSGWPQRIQTAVTSYQARGGRVATLGNEQDCLYDPPQCPDRCAILLFLGCLLFADETSTQIIPNANSHFLFALGNRTDWGHDVILHDPTAINYVVSFVGQ